MPHPIHDRLRELETEVASLKFRPAAAVRSRGRRRGRRQLATTAVALAVLATGAGFTATREWAHHPGTASPAGTPGLSCSLAVPADPVDVTVRMVDGGAPAALIDATDVQLRNRRFTVSNAHSGRPAQRVNGTATLHYGPATIGAATLVRAYLKGDTAMWFDPTRRDDTVDLLLGRTFAGLVTVTEKNQALVAAGEPSAPPGCTGVAPSTR